MHLIECQMPILSHPSEEDVNPSNGLDLALVLGALQEEVLGFAIEDVGVVGENVDLGEEVRVHESVV
jgi:hypothetical protein